MKNRCFASLAITFAVLMTSPNTVFAQSAFEVGIEAGITLDDIRSAYETIKKVQDVMRQIEEKKPITASQKEWEDLTTRFEKAAERLRLASEIPAFDSAKYTVTGEELAKCSTREASLAKLQSFAKSIADSESAGKSALARIDAAIADIEASRRALKYLLEANLRLAGSPVLGEVFAWNWFDLQNRVSPALGTAASSLEKQQKRLTENLKAAELKRTNLASNIQLMSSAKCDVVGTWRGQCFTTEGHASGTVLSLTKAGTEYSCRFERSLTGGLTVKRCSNFIFSPDNRSIGFEVVFRQSNGNEFSVLYSGSANTGLTSMPMSYLVPSSQRKGQCNLAK